MQGESVGRKRGHLHSIVGRIGAETIIKSKRPANNDKSPEEKFINPLLLNNPKFEIQQIEPREPSKKTKIYILQKPAGLTNGAYLSCSSCGRHAFKLYRVVKTKLAPKHLQKFGATENDLLRICKRCWYQGNNSELQPKELASRPFFKNESPLGATNRRACSGWHFLRRDLIKKRLCIKHDGSVPGQCNNKDDENEEELASIVTLIVNEGNSFHYQKNGVSLFSHDGTWFGLDEARYYGQSRSLRDKQMPLDFDRLSFESLVCDNFQLGNFVEPQTALIDHDYTSLFSEVEVTTEESVKKENKGIRAKNAAVKLLKHSIKKSKSSSAKTPLKNLKASQPLSRENKNKTRVIHKASVLERPPQATKPRVGSSDRHCVLCHVPILKSYGSYRRENAPDKLKGLFTNGVITVRACRRCVPYQKPIVAMRGGKVKQGHRKTAGFQRKDGKAKTNAAEKVVSPSSRATVKTKAPGTLHVVVSNSPHTSTTGTQDNAKQAKGGKSSTAKGRARTEAVRIDLTCSEEEGISTGIENDGGPKAGQQRMIKNLSAKKTGAIGPHRCVVCSKPVGKSYRRCLSNEVPPCYRYVFQQHRGEPRLRFCRKCLSRKNYPKTPGEKPSDG